jgi:hypothetical protein
MASEGLHEAQGAFDQATLELHRALVSLGAICSVTATSRSMHRLRQLRCQQSAA